MVSKAAPLGRVTNIGSCSPVGPCAVPAGCPGAREFLGIAYLSLSWVKGSKIPLNCFYRYLKESIIHCRKPCKEQVSVLATVTQKSVMMKKHMETHSVLFPRPFQALSDILFEFQSAC